MIEYVDQLNFVDYVVLPRPEAARIDQQVRWTVGSIIDVN